MEEVHPRRRKNDWRREKKVNWLKKGKESHQGETLQLHMLGAGHLVGPTV